MRALAREKEGCYYLWLAVLVGRLGSDNQAGVGYKGIRL